MRSPPALSVDREPTAASGGRLIVVAQALRVVIRLGSAAVLARLLTPSAYGVYGMAAAVFGVLYMARDVGIVTALQQPGLSPQRFNACCRLGLFGGLALAALGAAAALPIGWFFGDIVHIPWVLTAMCTAFVFSGLGAPAIGMLYRQQKAGLVAMIEAIAVAVGAIGGTLAATRGAGVWALVLMGVLTEAVSCALAWWHCPRRPTRDTSGTDWFSLATFGASLAGHNIATYFTRTLDQVTVGRSDGAHALGLYGRGAQIAALPAQYGIGPFTPYFVATLARLRESPAEYRAFFRRGLNGLLHVSLASAAACLAAPEVLVLVLFGDQWLTAVPIVRWLGVALAVQPWTSAPFWLLAGHGHGRRLLAWSLAGAAMMSIACLIAARFDMTAVALATAATAVLHATLAPVFCAGRTPARASDWLQPLLIPAITHGGFALVLATTLHFLPADRPDLFRTITALIVAVVYYLAIYLVSARVRIEIRGLFFWSR